MFGTLFLYSLSSLSTQGNTNKGVWMNGCIGRLNSPIDDFKKPIDGYPNQIETYKRSLNKLAIMIGFPVHDLRKGKR